MSFSRRWVAKEWRSVCGVTHVPRPAVSAAIWQTRLSWREVSGLTESSPGEQPALRAALEPPRPQQLQQLRREHRVPVLAPLALLDTDQHALGIDIADAQHHHLADAQARAVGDAQGRLILQAGAGCRFQKTAHLLGREHARQLARVVHAGKMQGELRTAERHGEQEAQGRRRLVDRRWPDAGPGR